MKQMIKGKTIEELEDLEHDLLKQDETKDGYYSQLISVYRKMHDLLRLLKREEPEEYEDQFQYVKFKLVAHYIKYGTYMKMGKVKDPNLAEMALRNALKYDSVNPIAHYRLGFLAYQNRRYSEALFSFQKAIETPAYYQQKEFTLNETQLYYAKLYSMNSALYVVEKTQQELQMVEQQPKGLSYELSPLLDIIQRNEEELLQQAFYCVTREGKRTCSKEECDELSDQDWKEPTLVLYFDDRQTVCLYDGEDRTLSYDRADILRHLLLVCSEEKPGTRNQFTSYFGEREIVIGNTFRKKVGRLIEDLVKIGAGHIIKETTVNNEKAYYIDENVRYVVLYRVDDIVAAKMNI